MPTFLEISKAQYPTVYKNNSITPLSGRSLAPVFTGKALSKHEFMFWEHEGNQAVRKGNWKAVKDNKRTEWDLYDLSTDKDEQNNVANTYPEVLKDLVTKWNNWATADYVLPKHSESEKDKNISKQTTKIK